MKWLNSNPNNYTSGTVSPPSCNKKTRKKVTRQETERVFPHMPRSLLTKGTLKWKRKNEKWEQKVHGSRLQDLTGSLYEHLSYHPSFSSPENSSALKDWRERQKLVKTAHVIICLQFKQQMTRPTPSIPGIPAGAVRTLTGRLAWRCQNTSLSWVTKCRLSSSSSCRYFFSLAHHATSDRSTAISTSDHIGS